ncbi:hypothetical protein ACFWG0_08135 [Streptomyces yangpuensis]|uniref:hypothetical protein n=1 Tax=Streptomyces yangpuensis TaxID=1648182 RepID=UPI003666C60A
MAPGLRTTALLAAVAALRQVRGPVTVTRTGGRPAVSRIIVGDPAARGLIEERTGTG